MKKILLVILSIISVLSAVYFYKVADEKMDKVVQLEYELDWTIAEKLELLETIDELETEIADLEAQLESLK